MLTGRKPCPLTKEITDIMFNICTPTMGLSVNDRAMACKQLCHMQETWLAQQPAKKASLKSRTIGLESEMRSLRVSRKPWSSTNWALISWSFATQTAAVFLTYGSSSFRHFLKGSQRYSVILSTRMQPMVRTARARMRGLGSSQS